MAESKCDKCEIRAFYAKAFDMHWLGEADCPYVCEEEEDEDRAT